MDVAHEVSRPSWVCRVCGQVWPCPPAQVQLAEAHTDRVGLATTMGALLHQATTELVGVPAGELWERFIAWTR